MAIRAFARVLLAAFTQLAAAAMAQEHVWQGAANGPRMRAQIFDKDKNLQHRLAVVQADLEGAVLSDPTDHQFRMPDARHIQFRLDQGAVDSASGQPHRV
jgi:hypothetical protein